MCNKDEIVLEISNAKRITNPSNSDIVEAVNGLDCTSGDAFLILSRNEMFYMQASGDSRLGFDLEYQEGSMQQHYRAKRNGLSSDDICSVLIAYRDNDPQWKSRFEFERIAW